MDKRIDVIATAMTGGIIAEGLADLELAYAPPFSSAKDPVNMLGYMAENVRTGACDVVEYDELASLTDDGVDAGRRPDTGARTGGNPRLDEPSTRPVPRGDRRRPWPVRRLLRGRTAGAHGDALLHELGIAARNLDGGYRTGSRRTPPVPKIYRVSSTAGFQARNRIDSGESRA